jgi:hypothetical protein
MSLYVTSRAPSPVDSAGRVRSMPREILAVAEATDHRRAGDTLAALRRAVMLGAALTDIAEIYAWGLNQESAAFRDADGAHLASTGMNIRRSRIHPRR